MGTKKTTAQGSTRKRLLKYFWGTFLVGILSIIFLFLLADWGVFGEMPDFKRLENPETNLASSIYSADDELLGKFYFNDNRTPVTYKDLPEHLVNALIATEDERFEKHSGIDMRGTLRAIVFLGRRGGASTITQQLAKLLFHREGSKKTGERYLQKIKEWIIAIRLERQYTKKEILTMYFNEYDFNNNADGIRSASRIYFGKEPKDLKIEEGAVLVGMFKNSSLYNPRRNPEGVTNRRNVVLAQMEKNHYLTTKEKDSLQKLPLRLNFNPEGHNEGIATYFREHLRNFMKEWIKDNPKPDGSKYDIYSDGLKIYTTIDSRMQAAAEEAVQKHMKNLQKVFAEENNLKKNKTFPFVKLSKEEIDRLMERAMKNSERWAQMKAAGISDKDIRASFYKETPMQVFSWHGTIDTVMTPYDSIRYYKSFLRTAILSMEPQTGHIKAWVGGIDYNNFKYDQVFQGARQVGSAFKPFVYATAIDQKHYTPCTQIPDVKTCIEANKWGNAKEWCPRNANGSFSGKMLTLKAALANSINSITAKLMDEVGPTNVIDLIEKLGINTKDIPALPSICLGSGDITLLEMVGAYGAFANEGNYLKPTFITRIEDKNGRIIYQHTPEARNAISPENAYTVIKLMEGVTQSGSGARLRTKGADGYDSMYKNVITGYPYAFKNAIAGKTGTTQNQSDGWFMGMVPNLVTGVWVGGEDRSVHFKGIRYGQGATMALPIWGYYMKKLYENKDLGVSKEAFPVPKNEDGSSSFNSSDFDCKGNDPVDAVGEDSEGIDF